MRKAFSFYRSHYEQMKQMTDKQKAQLITAICEVQFLERNINDITFKDNLINIVWVGIVHGIESSLNGYISKQKSLNKEVMTPLEGGQDKVTTPLEQEKEKEKEKEQGKGEYILSEAVAVKFKDLYNQLAVKQNLTIVAKMTDKRKNKLRQRFKNTKDFDKVFVAMLKKIDSSSFLLGGNNRGWKVDFDFMVANEDNYVKILEGKYDAR